MLAIRLPQAIEKRLEKLARRTGRTKSFYVREALRQHLEELEDAYKAERVLKRIGAGKQGTVPLVEGAEPQVRLLSECLRLARARRSKATADAEFAKDVAAAVESHREALEPPTWD